MFTMQELDVAPLCDQMPMDARPGASARPPLRGPAVAAAARLMSVTARYCAAVLSSAV